MAIELCPAIRASVHASQPTHPAGLGTCAGASRARRAEPRLAAEPCPCCFLRLEDSMWPLRVGAGHTQPSAGFPARSQRLSRVARTLGVIGSTRRAAAVLPCVTSSAPYRPLSHVIDSHCRRKHSSGRKPVSTSTAATEARDLEKRRGI